MAILPFEFDATTVPQLNTFDALPTIPAMAQLKSRRQWVAWKYMAREGGGKPTKPLYSPATGFKCSHSDPRHWGSYQEAVNRALRSRMDGVGYVLTDDDGLTGIDLDNCRDPDNGEIEPWAQAIVDLAETYCEVSPSETGLRLLALDKPDKAYKSDAAGVEIYGTARYLTITGWHVSGTPTEIRSAPRTMAALLARIDAIKPAPPEPSNAPGIVTTPLPEASGAGDAFRNVNSAALNNLALWVPAIFGSAARPMLNGTYRVSSQSLGRNLQEDLSFAPNGIKDFGVHDMGDVRMGGRTPIDIVIEFGKEASALDAAMWLCTRIGRDPADFGFGAHEALGAEAAANLLARTVIRAPDGTLADAETGEVLPEEKSVDGELPDRLTRVPGLVGRITDWITDTALYPQRGLALGAALVLVGTAAGRHLAGPTKNGTHLYVVGLAPSGAGKDHALGQIATILAASDMKTHIGPSQFISMPAVINFLCRAPLSVCAMDEFGAFLKRINNRKASGFEGAISGLLRTAWGSSFKAMPTPEWAGRAAETIFSPAMSIYGASTAREFYDSLEGGDVTNGVLNRFIIIETRKRPDERTPLADSSDVPQDIVQGMRSIYLRNPMLAAQLCQSTSFVPFDRIAISPGAEKIRKDLILELRAKGDADPSLEPFLARTAENALRLATIVAIGKQGPLAIIDAETMAWGVDFASWSTATLATGAGLYIADSDTQATANAVRRALYDRGGRMKRRDLLRALQHRYKARELEDVIKGLAEADHIRIEKEVPPKGGPPTLWYSLDAA